GPVPGRAVRLARSARFALVDARTRVPRAAFFHQGRARLCRPRKYGEPDLRARDPDARARMRTRRAAASSRRPAFGHPEWHRRAGVESGARSAPGCAILAGPDTGK